MKTFFDGLTPVVAIQAILSIIVVVTFCYQEWIIHSVDADLKLITFGIVGFWLGGLSFIAQQRINNGVNKYE